MKPVRAAKALKARLILADIRRDLRAVIPDTLLCDLDHKTAGSLVFKLSNVDQSQLCQLL